MSRGLTLRPAPAHSARSGCLLLILALALAGCGISLPKPNPDSNGDTPDRAAAALASGLTPIGTLGSLVSIGTLMAFVIVSLGIIVLRRTRPDLPRPFRTPWVPVVPILGILFNLAMMFGLGVDNWLRLVIWMAIGLVIYFTFGKRRSTLRDEPALTPSGSTPAA